MAQSRIISIRVPPDMLHDVDVERRVESRNRTNMVLVLVREALDWRRKAQSMPEVFRRIGAMAAAGGAGFEKNSRLVPRGAGGQPLLGPGEEGVDGVIAGRADKTPEAQSLPEKIREAPVEFPPEWAAAVDAANRGEDYQFTHGQPTLRAKLARIASNSGSDPVTTEAQSVARRLMAALPGEDFEITAKDADALRAAGIDLAQIMPSATEVLERLPGVQRQAFLDTLDDMERVSGEFSHGERIDDAPHDGAPRIRIGSGLNGGETIVHQTTHHVISRGGEQVSDEEMRDGYTKAQPLAIGVKTAGQKNSDVPAPPDRLQFPNDMPGMNVTLDRPQFLGALAESLCLKARSVGITTMTAADLAEYQRNPRSWFLKITSASMNPMNEKLRTDPILSKAQTIIDAADPATEEGAAALQGQISVVINRLLELDAENQPFNPYDCPDCCAAMKYAYSDATTPGFFYDRCKKHRKLPVETPDIRNAVGVAITREVSIKEAKRIAKGYPGLKVPKAQKKSKPILPPRAIPGVKTAAELPTPKSRACPTCGAMNGLHQKGCKERR